MLVLVKVWSNVSFLHSDGCVLYSSFFSAASFFSLVKFLSRVLFCFFLRFSLLFFLSSLQLSSFAFSHNENLIIFGTFSGKLFAYSSFSGLLLIKFMNSTKPILGLKFLPKNSRIFFTSCADNIIRLYDLKKCSVNKTILISAVD